MDRVDVPLAWVKCEAVDTQRTQTFYASPHPGIMMRSWCCSVLDVCVVGYVSGEGEPLSLTHLLC